jgi:tetratricopeptide (TPR) repeat protein
MRRAWLAVVLLSVACASAPIRKADQATVLTADARVLEGCYSCLIEARDIYQRLAVARARPVLVTRLFETLVLIGQRERELAMDPTDSYLAAEALIPELPVTYDAARYLEIARAIPPDHIGATRAERSVLYRRNPPPALFNALKAGLETGEGSAPFRAYLSASLECLREFANRRTEGRAEIPDDAPPLVRYRMGTCPTVRQLELDAVTDAVPAFVEARLFRARVPVLNQTSQYTRDLREALNAAFERFPRSPSVTYGLGALNQTIGDCTAAIRHYEDTIVLSPLHEDAALQRVICLGHIGSFVPAIEGATRIIERRYYNVGDAYYWRAWSHYKRKDLPAARADVDAARREGENLKVLTLGGMVKYDQGELDLAEADLRAAISMDVYNETCIARWYYGLVGFAREDWPETATRFAAAGTCYRNAANRSRRDLAAMRTADVDEAFRATQIAGFEAVIKEDTDQEEASYLNTANCHARAGDIAKAKEWLDRIPVDSVHALIAAELRKQIGGGA